MADVQHAPPYSVTSMTKDGSCRLMSKDGSVTVLVT
jgi:hypothetical protein